MCYLKVFWAINVIAVDDDGASTIERYHEYSDTIDNAYMQNSELGGFFDEYLADVNWMLDNASCMQEAIPKFDLFDFGAWDHEDAVSSGEFDRMVRISFIQASGNISWSDLDIGIEVDGAAYNCSTIQMIEYPCFLEQDGQDDMVWETSEDIVISENAVDMCDGSGPCVIIITVQNVQTGEHMGYSWEQVTVI